jgi:cysteine desulfurase/selenocysteine lyase
MNNIQIKSPIDIEHCRKDFPTLDQEVNGYPLTFLDSAASSQQPSAVINAISQYHSENHANVHRGVHTLSHRATESYEGARDKVCSFINASSRSEVIFTSGATESINLVAQSFCRPKLNKGDQILISWLEHHSNIVPWQLVCEQTGAELIVAPINKNGEIDTDAMISMMTKKVKMLAVGHISNALGTVNPLKKIISAAKDMEIPVLIDGAQGVPHMDVDVQSINCDFYVFSGHKMLGPTGIGVLWGKEKILEAMPPFKSGGDMILEVSFDKTTFNELPYKFEAGTPNISGAVGLGAAIDYLQKIGMNNVYEHEKFLHTYMINKLKEVEGIKLIGKAKNQASVQSFQLDDIHPHDLGSILDHQGVAVRTGHHCAMPVMKFLEIPGTTRASLGLYNNTDDINRLIDALEKARQIFK